MVTTLESSSCSPHTTFSTHKIQLKGRPQQEGENLLLSQSTENLLLDIFVRTEVKDNNCSIESLSSLPVVVVARQRETNLNLDIIIMNSDSDSDWDSMSEAPKPPAGGGQQGKN